MRVTWTSEQRVAGHSGNQVQCRDEKEAAELVLRLLLAGVPLAKIIVDGAWQDLANKEWIWKAFS